MATFQFISIGPGGEISEFSNILSWMDGWDSQRKYKFYNIYSGPISTFIWPLGYQ